MDFLGNHVYEIVSSIVAIGLGFLSLKYKGKMDEIKDFAQTLLNGLEDGTLTPEEIQVLVQKGKKMLGL